MDSKTVLHPQSGIAPLSQFDLWAVPSTQISAERDVESDHRPMSSVSQESPIEFQITTARDEYLNFAETYLYLKCRVKLNKDGEMSPTSADWDTVIPTQYFMHSIFKQVDLYINGKSITHAPQEYNYKAYLEALLGFCDDAKKSYLTASLWMSDSERNKEIRPLSDTSPIGKTFDMYGRLHLDLTFQERLLIGGCELRIMLTRDNPQFYFQTGDGVKPTLEIQESILYVHKTKATPALLAAHTRAHSINPVVYPISRNEIVLHNLSQGFIDATMDNVIRGQMPRRIFVSLVPQSTLRGNYRKNPYQFDHFDICYFAAFVDGVQYPSQPFTPNFSSGLYAREFVSLYTALNQNNTDSFASITKKDFGKGNTIFAVNFAPDLSSGPGAVGHVSPIHYGFLRLHIKFAKALTESVNVIMYVEYDNVIEIHETRQVTTSYN